MGALTFSGISAVSADVLNLVGKKVQSEAKIKLNNEIVDTAIVIDGKSYGPLRSVYEKSGFDVKFEKGVVSISKADDVVENAVSLEDIEMLRGSLERAKKYLEGDRFKLAYAEEMSADPTKDAKLYAGEIEFYRERLPKAEKEIANLEAKLAELEEAYAKQQNEKTEKH